MAIRKENSSNNVSGKAESANNCLNEPHPYGEEARPYNGVDAGNNIPHPSGETEKLADKSANAYMNIPK